MEVTQKFFSVTFMIQLSIMGPNLALSLYAFMKSQPGDQIHYFFLVNVIFSIFQFLFYCWFGTELTSRVNLNQQYNYQSIIYIHKLYYLQSCQLNNAIFESNWLAIDDTRNKMALLMLMIMATRPIVFTPGYVVELSIETFTKVPIRYNISNSYTIN